VISSRFLRGSKSTRARARVPVRADESMYLPWHNDIGKARAGRPQTARESEVAHGRTIGTLSQKAICQQAAPSPYQKNTPAARRGWLENDGTGGVWGIAEMRWQFCAMASSTMATIPHGCRHALISAWPASCGSGSRNTACHGCLSLSETPSPPRDFGAGGAIGQPG